jgi:hypothetical protein
MNKPSKHLSNSSGTFSLCAICGRYTDRIESDHPLQRANDRDYTIPLCVPDHREVTKRDTATRRCFALESSMATFIFTLHRIQLTFERHGQPEISDSLRKMESALIDRGGYRVAESRGKHATRHPMTALTDSSYLVMQANIDDWIENLLSYYRNRDSSLISLITMDDIELLTGALGSLTGSSSPWTRLTVDQVAEVKEAVARMGRKGNSAIEWRNLLETITATTAVTDRSEVAV